ncbi:hypothetical protein BDV18DRAFT_39890 [Aspergillus unguis]
MSFDRVIQDSDEEEEEPLGDLSPEQTNRVSEKNYGVQQHDAKSIGTQKLELNQEAHIDVNFDAFLQSPEAPQRTLSASQQHREERWIPDAGPRRVGSMGNMMTEIGLAQQRLFDDEQQAQYAHQPAAPEQAHDTNYEMATPEAMVETQDLPTEPVHNQISHDQNQQMDPSDDWSQSVSNNIFDSSSHTPTGQLNRADFLRDSVVTAETEPIRHAEFRRWASMMQAAASSPHDTEPFSSVISPRATRAKSDNAALNPTQQSSASVDELVLPVTNEMPKVEKRGRKKKQPVPVDDEDDELAHPEPTKSAEPQPSKPQKRKPGRPPKNPKVPAEDSVNTGPVDLRDSAGAPGEMNHEITQDSVNIQPNDAVETAASSLSIIREPKRDNQPESLAGSGPEQNEQVAPQPANETKKKKLKRGKTTSVTLTKTRNPDVEDDVIWVDERSTPTTNDETLNSRPDEQDHSAPAEQAPPPKKRGRKRKKTTEQLAEETAAPQAAGSDAQASVPVYENDPLPQDEAINGAGKLVVMDNKENSYNQGSNATNPILEEDQQEHQQPASPTRLSENPEPEQPPETPQKGTDPKTPAIKGPGKHSPISSTSKVPYRVGLSKRARIAPLLKIIKR